MMEEPFSILLDKSEPVGSLQLDSADEYIFQSSKDKRWAVRNPATGVDPKPTHTIFTNLWYNNGRCGASFIGLVKQQFQLHRCVFVKAYCHTFVDCGSAGGMQ